MHKAQVKIQQDGRYRKAEKSALTTVQKQKKNDEKYQVQYKRQTQ